MIRYIIAGIFCLLGASTYAQNLWTSGRPDGHAPISVMGDHTHNKGEFMVSYRFMSMYMENMRSDTETLSNEEVLNDFMVTPLEMHMNMHMIGIMYAVSDELTLSVMGNYQTKSMDHLTRMGGTFTTESEGFGDLKIGALYKVLDKNRQRLHLNLGVSFPTGSIEEKDVTPASAPNEAQLPYPMQIGSGSVNAAPELTYLLQKSKTSLGAQATGLIRINENSRGYRFGNEVQFTAWGAYKVTNWLSASLKGRWQSVGSINGSDDTYMNPMMVPTVNAENFGGSTLFAGGGINFYIPEGPLKNVRFGVELDLPIYQDLNGPQMEAQNMMTLGVQYAL